jgi:DNA-binding CsgD family transcriptional regulator
VRISKSCVSKRLPVTSAGLPTTQFAVVEQLKQRGGLLTAAETCRILGTHRKTLYKRLASEDLPGIKEHGKWKIDARDLYDYIRGRELTGISTQRHRKANSVPSKAPAADNQGAIECQEHCSAAEELQKYGITLESVTVTIPRLIVNCILRQAGTADTQHLSNLTRAEQRVYDELKVGKYDKEIADAIHRSESTVHFHVRNILRKLGLSSRREILLRNRHY